MGGGRMGGDWFLQEAFPWKSKERPLQKIGNFTKSTIFWRFGNFHHPKLGLQVAGGRKTCGSNRKQRWNLKMLGFQKDSLLPRGPKIQVNWMSVFAVLYVFEGSSQDLYRKWWSDGLPFVSDEVRPFGRGPTTRSSGDFCWPWDH